MLKDEFEKRVGMKVSDAEFESINIVYNYSDDDIDKDKFCKAWAMLNRNRIAKYKEAEKYGKRISEYKSVLYDMVNTFLRYPYDLRQSVRFFVPLPNQEEALKFFNIDYQNMDLNKLLYSIQIALNLIK
jgi:hypothetical protein